MLPPIVLEKPLGKPCRKRRSSREILSLESQQNLAPPLAGSHEKLPRLSLKKNSINVSAGACFYEKAKSRRVRHRQVLKEQDSVRAVPLGSPRDVVVPAKGPHKTASITMARHEKCMPAESEVELEFQQEGRWRVMRLQEELNPHVRRGSSTQQAVPRNVLRRNSTNIPARTAVSKRTGVNKSSVKAFKKRQLLPMPHKRGVNKKVRGRATA